ncbi:hypothetical protein BLNAU_12049 [Blattamonas nauphoetae]|uniref:Uncharacterized protein n=1 Tax=Blattamonas nauphoetae TaxID=2049346 RepID=A0ABQ9XNH8_9EUKA|nr:hypothetical protein BLNAU_12049 [Blattamonas nauphoetae]
MTAIDKKTDPSSSTARSDLFCPPLPFSVNCSAFLNWNEELPQSDEENVVVFRSLVATVKLQPALDDSLEDKAVKLLESIHLANKASADAFLISLGKLAENSSRVITTAAMKMLKNLFFWCSAKIGLTLIQAGLIPQLIVTLNPQSLTFTEAVNIHTGLIKIILNSFRFATPNCLKKLGIEDDDDHSAVHETILTQVLTPSENLFWTYVHQSEVSIIVNKGTTLAFRTRSSILHFAMSQLSPPFGVSVLLAKKQCISLLLYCFADSHLLVPIFSLSYDFNFAFPSQQLFMILSDIEQTELITLCSI